MVRNYISWDFMGGYRKISVDIPCGPLMVDYTTHLTDAHEVTKYLCGKSKNKDYKVPIIYLPLVLTLTKKNLRH